MGRFDFHPRFYRRTDGLRMHEHKRKEQNEERGGSPLAFTPVAPPAAADFHSCLIDYTTKQQKKTKGAAGQTAKKAICSSITCPVNRSIATCTQ
jgi:hypothetical protein